MLFKNTLLVMLLVIFSSLSASAQPVVSSFSPMSGPIGTTVTIGGSNFSTTPSNNIVYFGAVRANVITASATSLVVAVPAGATYQPITVTVNGLTAYSFKPFIVTYSGGGSFNSTTFGPKNDFTTDLHPNGVVVADIDGDGKPDVATPNNYSIAGQPASISILRNTSAAGAISFATMQNINNGAVTYTLASGDIDGDGRPDLISCSLSDINISVFRNTSVPGAISFAPKVDYATTNGVFGIAVGDIDGDGRPDIAVTNHLGNTISVFRNTSTPGVISFGAKVDFMTMLTPLDIVIADLDGDSKQDIAVTEQFSYSYSLFRNTSIAGNISFGPRVDYTIAANWEPHGLIASDLDGDNKLDLAMVTIYTPTDGSSIRIARNNSITGNINFSLVENLISGTGGSYHVCAGDVNGDGKPDLAFANTGMDWTRIYQNNSTIGTFIFTNSQVAYSYAPYAVGLADLDADSRPELITSGFISDKISVFKNKCGLTGIYSFSPQSAASGATVTISGNNFTGATSVTFGGLPAASFTVVNSTTITAIVGSGASGNVVVSAPLGTDSLAGFAFVSIPTVTSFTPTSAATGTPVTITGTNFTGVTAVSFGFAPAASFTVINSTMITAVIGAGASGAVTVTNSSGTGSLGGFIYLAPPVISSFTPIVAGTGMTVQISGSNFLGATSVTFGGVPAISFTVVSSSVIGAVVGSGASGSVAITTPNGTGSKTGFFYVPPPAIASFSPTRAPANTTVTINGANFSGAIAVSFGGIAASSFNVPNSTTINAVVANGASGNVSVTTPYGTSTLGGFTYIPPPSITSFSPTSGPPGTTVTITGTNLSGIYAVSFQGRPAVSFTIVNATTIIAVAGDGNTGPIIVSGTNGFFTSTSDFTFNYSPPTISSFNPTSGTTGTSVNITGTNFIAVTGVSFGGISASNFYVNSPTSITAIVANGITGSVTVNTLGGTATSAGFTFTQQPPTITTFNPIDATKGTAITITGANFNGVTSVKFGGIPAVFFNVNSNSSITAIVGNGASGVLSVSTPGGTGNSGAILTYYDPIITSFTPTTAGTGATVTINGSGFFNLSAVKFGGVPASSYTIESQNQINAVVGSGASGEVSVTTNYFTAALSGFTFSSPATIIGSVSPSIASNGMTINITGYGFTGATSVMIGGVPASSYVINSTTSITAVVGTATSGDITVTSPSGTGTFNGFIYSTAPVIASFSPETATIGSSITIKGRNFNAVAANNIVYFGPVRATVFSATDTSVVAFVPIGATHDRISITTNTRTGYSPKFFRPTFTGIGSLTVNSFASKVDSTVSASPSHISISDLNIDGKSDIIVSSLDWNLSQGRITVYKNSGSPDTISFNPRISLTDNAGPIHTISGDLDGDGKHDLVTGNLADIYGVSIFRNTSTDNAITFENQILLSVFALGSFRTAIGDLNGDGKPEVAVASEETHAVQILRNTSTSGTISFAPLLTFAAPQSPMDISIADIDMDAKPDIIVSGGANSGALRVLRNTSTASVISFNQSIDFITGNLTRKLVVGDIDGDGKPDVALVNETPRTLSIFRNTSIPGTISFANKIEIITGGGPSSVAFADIDGNSKLDLVVASNYESTVSVFSNASTVSNISFSPMVNFTVGNGPSGVTVGDFDMDGKPDIASSNKNSSTVSILRNLMDGVFINSFTPQSASAGTTITITGTNFNGATAVSFGGVVAQSFTVNSATSITAVVAGGSSGTITVTTPAGTATIAGFTFVTPAPTITSFTPTSAGTGTTVTIKGTNFTGATAVSFGGTAATSFIVVDSTTITAVVGNGANGDVSVTTAGGSANVPGFIFNFPTGLPGVNGSSNNLIIYPNPSRTSIIVDHPVVPRISTISIIDMYGRAIKKISVPRSQGKSQLDIQTLSSGVYKILWTSEQDIMSGLFFKN
jgi:hypothetical protein